MKILHIDSSIQNENSVSRQLSKKVIERLTLVHPSAVVTYLDCVKNPPAHLSESFFTLKPEDNKFLQDFLNSDVIVIGTPMYNFSIPSQLKTWIDHISIAGQTFKYTDKGPIGLAVDKKVYIVSASGGAYLPGSQSEKMDFQKPYLKTIFQFLGVQDINIIQAEGLAKSDQEKKVILESATKEIEKIK